MHLTYRQLLHLHVLAYVADSTLSFQKPGNRKFSLKLKPTSSSLEDISAILTTTFPPTYPKSSPICTLSFGEGVSAESKSRIESSVRSALAASVGSEVIFELATAIQELLDETLTASTDAQNLPALDEERAIQEAELQQAAESARQAEEQKQQALDDEEERTLAEMVGKEKRRLAQQANKNGKGNANGHGRQVPGGLTFDQDIKLKSPAGTLIVFRTVCDRIQLRDGTIGRVFTVRPAEADKTSKHFLTLKEYIFDHVGSDEKYKKSMQFLESGLDTLVKFPEHPGISMPIAFSIQRKVVESVKQKWTITVLEELAPKGCLADMIETVGKLEAGTVKSWTLQIIDALEFLHGHRIVHARLHPGNVLLVKTPAGNTVPKLTDVSFQNNLHGIAKDGRSKFSSAISAYWLAPEIASKSEEAPSSTRDIWDLGVLMAQMMFGLDVQREYVSPDALIDSLDLTPSLEDLFCRIFQKTPKSRPSAFGLRPSEFLRNDDPILEPPDSPDLSRMSSLNVQSLPETPRPRRESLVHPFTPGLSSRYVNDFVEEGRLGKGGFGQVVRARNRLDGRVYAVKKVHASSREALDSVISETILLSKMNHPNVVRYYTAVRFMKTKGF